MLRPITHAVRIVKTSITIINCHIMPSIRLTQARQNERGRGEQQENGKDNSQNEFQLSGHQL